MERNEYEMKTKLIQNEAKWRQNEAKCSWMKQNEAKYSKMEMNKEKEEWNKTINGRKWNRGMNPGIYINILNTKYIVEMYLILNTFLKCI